MNITSTIPKQDLQKVNSIAHRSDSSALNYSASDFTELQFIASQCPYEYGPSVYVARTLLSPVDTISYQSDCETITSSISAKSLQKDTVLTYYNLFDLVISPNPANTFLNVQLNTQQQQNYQWQVISIDGKSVLLSDQIRSHNQAKIDISMIAIGVYLFAINDDFGNARTLRFVIIR